MLAICHVYEVSLGKLHFSYWLGRISDDACLESCLKFGLRLQIDAFPWVSIKNNFNKLFLI